MAGRPAYILGISAFYHDSAAALLRDGEIVGAAQEERFTRVKHDRAFPRNAVDYCLREAGIGIERLDSVIYYDKPLLTFDRILETSLAFAPAGFPSFRAALPPWLHEKLDLPRVIDKALDGRYAGKLLFSLHHLSHAASAFYPSPFESAAVITADGAGEWATTSVGVGRGADLKLLREIRFPHSLGLLYSAFTSYLGFKVNSGEYKVMGLAPYGEPRYYDAIVKNLIDVKEDGSFHMDIRFFNYCQGLTMTSGAFHELFGGPPRAAESALEKRHMDLAASVQKAADEIMLKIARHARALTGEENLCLAGGVALNCVANGLIQKEKVFKRLFVQPAAGDAGGALGAALVNHHLVLKNPRRSAPRDSLSGGFLGPKHTSDEARAALERAGVEYERLSPDALRAALCAHLEAGKVVGVFQGRMEFGPRALGARSILGDPRDPGMRSRMNLKIKFRESFRPFAPAVLAEDRADYFDLDCESPYMMLTAAVREERRGSVPATTHVDHSARVQTVSEEENPFFHGLLRAWKEKTGCPVLVNTSFNVRGEPIVGSPDDAVRCFLNTEMDVLALEDCLAVRSERTPKADRERHLKSFAPD